VQYVDVGDNNFQGNGENHLLFVLHHYYARRTPIKTKGNDKRREEKTEGGRDTIKPCRPQTALHTIRLMEEDGCPKLRMNEAAPKEMDDQPPDLFFVSLSFA
jgi:hypothetical protein